MDSPDARNSRRVWTGTRVPEKTGVPPITSGLQEMTGLRISRDYSQLRGRRNIRASSLARFQPLLDRDDNDRQGRDHGQRVPANPNIKARTTPTSDSFQGATSNASCASVSKLRPLGRGTIADWTDAPATWIRLPNTAMMASCRGRSIEGNCHQVSLAGS